jgi:hypothetical protein
MIAYNHQNPSMVLMTVCIVVFRRNKIIILIILDLPQNRKTFSAINRKPL